ncbi:two-component system sensor histidine kinase CreC [Lysobacter sp. HDW10]|uniref:two-component system sensor histidine kinase CreC n=1 Tax=Lysobacter sp. HDW10 TaxID=2714936 RepID=UPI00140A33BA|nr:two-component system sensor histidine kinase CreC [Lysobacter sp. HDW10]QIK81725.1 two-component system sensor histidine kinase CreC [Lysobacter sp. HDW10]
MKIAWRVLLGYFLIVAMAAFMLGQVFLEQIKPAVRQTAEDTLADTANSLAELASEDLATGQMADGLFARRMRSLSDRRVNADIWGYKKQGVAYRITVTDAKGSVVFDSQGKDLGRDNSRWNDVARTLRGEYGARSTREQADDPASTVMWVAAPIRHEGKLIGVLSIGKPNRVLQPFITESRNVILKWGIVLLGVALLIGIAMAWWLSSQLGHLRAYAQAVTAGKNAPAPKASAEFGELGRALEHMRTELDGKEYVEEYVHTLTHELKSPLASIQAAAEILEGPLDVADHRKFVGHIQSQSSRMAEMVEQLLALASVEQRRQLDSPEPVDVHSVLRDAIASLETKAAAANVRIDVVGATQTTVMGDPFLLRQALINLLDNAIEFSPVNGHVRCELIASEASVTVQIDDHGPGIPEFALGRVFERFYSLPRHTGGSRSSGIGLSFVAAIAALHNGTAHLVNTEAGARATLTVSR